MTAVCLSRHVLAIELDSGTLFLADAPGALGRDALLPAVTGWGAITAAGLEVLVWRDALPAETEGAWWTNREAAVIEVAPDAGSVYDGAILFDGVLAAEPSEEGGVLRLELIPPRRRVVAIPDYGIVAATDWPLASDAAMGRVKPLIVGTVEECPLLPVRLPAASRLAADANPGDGQIELEDAAGLAAAGTVMVDGHSYVYTAKSAQGNVLLGVSVTGRHRQGTACAQAGDTVFLAAGHACAALSDLRADGAPISGATVDLAAATATFAAPPLKIERSERFTLTAQFDQVGAGATAQNPANAIRAVTGAVNQAATGLPVNVTAATPGAGITFARPAGRIVKGVYTVSFTVVVGAQAGWARVKIGNEVVWFLEPPASVLYHWSPATILLDDDSDFLPVMVDVAEGGADNQVSVTVTAASRVASLGNLDDANFAVLRGPSNLLWRADQTGALPDRGPIARAQLWVRWFASGAAALPAATATFAGRALGKLEQTQLANATLQQTISVDVVSQGQASLPQQAISTYVSGGTASLSHASIPQSVTLPAAFSYPFTIGGLVVRPGVSRVPQLTGWDASLGSIACKLQVQTTGGAAPADIFKWVDLLRASGALIAQIVASGGSWVNVASNIYETTVAVAEAPDSLNWTENEVANGTSLLSLTLYYNARPTLSAVAQNNAPASGYSSPLVAQNLGHSGTAVAASNGAINFVVPAPPRVVDQLFDLSWVRGWGDLTGQAEIAYTAGGPDLCLAQVALIAEYDARVYARADTLTATVTGLSGNPADVIALLAAKTGQQCDARALGRLRDWCEANSYRYGRRIAETADSLTELTTALSQVHALACHLEGRLAPVRRLDFGREVGTVREADLLAPASIGWAGRIENAITLRYRAGSDGNPTRALVADAASNSACRRGQAAIRETRAVEVNCGWIRDDTAAARYLADAARLHARPRRTLELACTFAATRNAGDLIEYLPQGKAAGCGIAARVISVSLDGPWPTLTAEEIPP